MIRLVDLSKYGQESYVITQLSDVANLPKRGRATGSTAILYETNGNMRIWNFIENQNTELNGQWIEMV